MDQNPAMQGGNTPAQDTQPTNNQPNPTNPSIGVVGDSGATNPAVTPSEPIAPVTPNPIVMTGPTVAPTVPPKKKHTGLIIAIIVLVLLILTGGGFAIWYFAFYNNPETVALDAINSFMHEKNVTATGLLWAENGYDERIELSMTNSAAANAGGMSDITFRYGNSENHKIVEDESIELNIGTVAVKDGVFYLRVGNIMETLDLFFEQNGVNVDEFDDSERIVYQLVETFDGQWWRVSFLDILDEIAKLDDSGEVSDQIKYTREFYNCMLDVAKQDISDEMTEIYKKNRFLVVKKVTQIADVNKKAASGNSLYELTFDYDKMADFINAIPHSKIAEQSYVCYNDYSDKLESTGGYAPEKISADDFDTVYASDLRETFEDSPLHYYVEIADWGHQLKGFFAYAKAETGSGEVEIDLQFTYDKVTIEEPKDYRPITDLVEEVINAFMSVVGNYGVDFGGYDDDYYWDDDDYIYDDDDWYYDDIVDGEEV